MRADAYVPAGDAAAPAGPAGEVGSLGWIEHWRRLVNDDADLRYLGRYACLTVKLGFGEREYLVRIVDGEIASARPAPPLLPGWDVALSASPAAWERFVEPYPPPYFHDLFAMVKGGHLKLEGNVALFLQNVRALKAYLGAFRRLGR